MPKSPKQIDFKRKGGRRLVGISGREIETRGLADSFWTDLYHRSMTIYWPTFFGTAAAIFVFLNAAFAFLYWLGNEPVANVAGNEPLGSFLLLGRDAGHGRLRRHAPADPLWAFHRHDRNLHRHDVPRRDDRADLRPFLAAARALHLRRPPGGDRPSRPADADDPDRQRAQQYDFAGDGATVADTPGNDHSKAVSIAAITSCCSTAANIRCSC